MSFDRAHDIMIRHYQQTGYPSQVVRDGKTFAFVLTADYMDGAYPDKPAPGELVESAANPACPDCGSRKTLHLDAEPEPGHWICGHCAHEFEES